MKTTRDLLRILPLAACLLGPAAVPTNALAQGKPNANDSVAKEEAPKDDPGSPAFAYVLCGLITFGILTTICKGSRRTVVN